MVQIRKKTTNEPREKLMRSEYIAKYLMGKRFFTEYKLGAPTTSALMQNLTPAQMRALGVRKVHCDLIVFYPEHLEIYEFQIVPRWSKFAQLLVYKELARMTDELKPWWNTRIDGILINAVDDPFLAALCHKYDLKYGVYTPEWLPTYLETLSSRVYTPVQIQPPGTREE